MRSIFAILLTLTAAGCRPRVDLGPEGVFLQARECLEKGDLRGYASLWDPREPRFLLANVLRPAADVAHEPGPRAILDGLLKKYKVRDVPDDATLDLDEYDRQQYRDVTDPVSLAVEVMIFTKVHWPQGRKPYVHTVAGRMTETRVLPADGFASTQVVMPDGKYHAFNFAWRDGRWYLGQEFVP